MVLLTVRFKIHVNIYIDTFILIVLVKVFVILLYDHVFDGDVRCETSCVVKMLYFFGDGISNTARQFSILLI